MKTIGGLLFLVTVVSGQWDPHFAPGRHSIVHLFEWKWNDIALECERFLGPMGYGGVQTSPVSENVLQLTPFRPWSERYTPVSYKLITRSGNEEEFKSMVERCNTVGVRIFVDVVINHMSGSGSCCEGTGGSSFDPAAKIYPGVPYGPEDFNWQGAECPSASGLIEDYTDVNQIKNCELDTLRDLNQGKSHVQDMIAGFLNKLVSFGVAGFRCVVLYQSVVRLSDRLTKFSFLIGGNRGAVLKVDASKFMWPEDLEVIFNRLTDLPTSAGFPAGSKPFLVMEVWDLAVNPTDPIRGSNYHHLGRTTEFQYGMFLGDVFRGFTPLNHLINFGTVVRGEPWGMYPSDKVLVFVDNHDNQRHQGFYDNNILTFRDSKLYRMAQGFAQAWPHGIKRIMSSYYWEENWQDGHDLNNWMGPPNTDGNTNDVPINEDLTCGGGWICEHRWREIFNMVQFGSVVDDTEVTNWWDNGNSQISFCRGNKGFVAINNEDVPLNQDFMTCLPAGTYCDVISGNLYNGSCSGKNVNVNEDGVATINILASDETPMIAIHIEAKL